MKAAELTGAELDYWVSRALGLDFRGCVLRERFDAQEWLGYEQSWGRAYGEWSTNWAHGGPIIDLEKISTFRCQFANDWQACYDIMAVGGPAADASDAEPSGSYMQAGPTPLIAAMRALVTRKYGYSVPDEVPA